MALPKAMSAMTCTARHSVLLEVRPRSCLSAAGRVTGALSPAARPRRRGAPSPRTPLRCRTGGADRLSPLSVLLSPSSGKAPARGGDPGAPAETGERALRRGAPAARGLAYPGAAGSGLLRRHGGARPVPGPPPPPAPPAPAGADTGG